MNVYVFQILNRVPKWIVKSKCKSDKSKKNKKQNNIVSKANEKKVIKIDMCITCSLHVYVLCICVFENYAIVV